MEPPGADACYALSNHVRFAPRADGTAVYHSLLGGLCLVDDAVAGILRGFHGGALIDRLLSALPEQARRQGALIVDIFAAKGFLVPPKDDEYDRLEARVRERLAAGLADGRRVGVVQLVVSNRCNFRCTYCFINQGYGRSAEAGAGARSATTMSPDIARLALDGVLGVMREAGTSRLAVQFFGGEPLLNIGTIRFVLEHYGRTTPHGGVIDYSIVTNGSLVDEATAALLARHGVTVIVSIDSFSPDADQRRTVRARSGTARVAENISRLRAAGASVIVNTVLSEQTIGAFEGTLIDHVVEWGIPEIGVLLDLNPEFYARHPAGEIVDALWTFYRRGQQRRVTVTGYWHTTFQRMRGYGQLERRGYKSCSATGCQLSVEPDGEVYACKASAGHFGHVCDLKSLLAGDAYRRYAMRAARNAPACKGCEIENFCSGLCLGPVEKRFGTLEAVVDGACDVYRQLVRRLIADDGTVAEERYGMYVPDAGWGSGITSGEQTGVGGNCRSCPSTRPRLVGNDPLARPRSGHSPRHGLP